MTLDEAVTHLQSLGLVAYKREQESIWGGTSEENLGGILCIQQAFRIWPDVQGFYMAGMMDWAPHMDWERGPVATLEEAVQAVVAEYRNRGQLLETR